MGVATEGRAETRARRHTAIVDAALALYRERHGDELTVEDIARRAGVSRRTVFNHFDSLDGVRIAACGRAIADIVEEFLQIASQTPIGDGSPAAMFDEVTTAVRKARIPEAIVTSCEILGRPDSGDDKAAMLHSVALERVGTQLRAEVVRRADLTDILDADLLIGALLNGIMVVAKHWIASRGLQLDNASRAEWDFLLTRLIDTLRDGHIRSGSTAQESRIPMTTDHHAQH